LCRNGAPKHSFSYISNGKPQIKFVVSFCTNCHDAINGSLPHLEQQKLTGLKDLREHDVIGPFLLARSINPGLSWESYKTGLR
jgi:hypothetical protein